MKTNGSRETVLTLHPLGKKGVNIDAAKYHAIKDAITQVLKKQGPISFSNLNRAVAAALGGSFEGSVSWYVVAGKLDMEARGIIGRIPGTSPQMLRLTPPL